MMTSPDGESQCEVNLDSSIIGHPLSLNAKRAGDVDDLERPSKRVHVKSDDGMGDLGHLEGREIQHKSPLVELTGQKDHASLSEDKCRIATNFVPIKSNDEDEEEEEVPVKRRSKKDKGKGKGKARNLPELPEAVWRKIFIFLYDSTAEGQYDVSTII